MKHPVAHLTTLLVAAFLSVLSVPSVAQNAESPRYIPFQAQVTGQDGELVPDGQYSVIFNLYETAVGGQPVWSERHVKIGVTNGSLNVFLGSISDLSGVAFSTAKYLGITVDVDNVASTPEPEMVPRSVIIPAFHAKTAENASKLAGQDWSSILVGGSNDPDVAQISAAKIQANGLTQDQLATNSVEADEIAPNAVGSLEIADEAITRAHLSPNVLNAIVPAGTIVPFAGPVGNIPDGWLFCGGQGVDKDGNDGQLQELYDAIGTSWGDGSTGGGNPATNDFNLPDLRGLFLRGLDLSAGRDPDRESRVALKAGGNEGGNVGSYQEFQIQRHHHAGVLKRLSSGTGPVDGSGGGAEHDFTGNTSDAGGNETRPRNVYVLYIIKY